LFVVRFVWLFDRCSITVAFLPTDPPPGGQKSVAIAAAEPLRKSCGDFIISSPAGTTFKVLGKLCEEFKVWLGSLADFVI
jgi:hypothetical protein